MQRYPQIADYNEVVQHPGTAFFDPELRAGRIAENGLGLPMVLSGGFALTYMLVGARRKLAVRCFHRQIPALERRYAAISRAFRGLNSPYFVDFEFLGRGIRVRADAYPILKMDWAEGEILGVWLERHHPDPAALARLRGEFAGLARYLEDHRISHGDIQNGNVIVSPQGLKLVDYDGVYVPGMPVGDGSESGHKHFQHPQRSSRDHGPGIDRFSFIALDLSLAALIEDPSLFRRYREGGETILFRANDFADPDNSEVFGQLSRMPALAGPARNFAAICRAPMDAVPTLEEYLGAGPAVPAAPAPRPAPPARAPYIGTYPVVGAADFAGVMSHVGHRVELVGRIASVKPGGDARGQEPGGRALQVSFSRHWRNMVGATIWCDPGEAAAALSAEWPGRWVSAAGLIGQPRVTDAFLVPRTAVGIVLDGTSRLNFISQAEAEYRLAQPTGAAPAAGAAPRAGDRVTAQRPENRARGDRVTVLPRNTQIVSQLRAAVRPAPTSPTSIKPARAQVPADPPPPSRWRPNSNIVGRLRTRGPVAAKAAPYPHPAAFSATAAAALPRVQPTPQRHSGRSPVMVMHPQPAKTAAIFTDRQPRPAPPPAPPSWFGLVLRKLGFRG